MRRKQHIKSRPMPNQTPTFPYLYIGGALLATMYISPAMALSSQTPTSRYMKEMIRLLGDEMKFVASPEKAPPSTEVDLTLEANGKEDKDQQQLQPPSWSFPMGDEPSISMFDGSATQTEEEEVQEKRFDTPRPPPSDPYFQQQKKLFGGYYQTNQTPNENEPRNGKQIQAQTNEPKQQPKNLFDALNQQIEALGQQMQTSSNSLRDVIDETFKEPESGEWGHDIQDGYFQVNEGYSLQQAEFFETVEEANGSYYEPAPPTQLTDFESLEPNGAFYEPVPPPQMADIETVEANGAYYESLPPTMSTFESAEQYQSYDQQISGESSTRLFEYQQSEQELALRQELERMAAEKRAAEEAAQRANQELQQREQLERQRLEQERIAAAQAEADRVEQLQKEKEDLILELARQKAEEYRKGLEAKSKPTVAIQKIRMPQLPDTNDPLELLGLDYRNPPETAEDIRRAFLKMAKKHHPDSIAADATPEERERASYNFARINSAYQLVKEKHEWLGDEYFATMMGGPMYSPRGRSSHIRTSFSHGYGFDDYGSMFSGNTYSATYGPKNGRRRGGPHSGYGQTRSPYRNRRQAGDNCHVSGDDFPPFFNN